MRIIALAMLLCLINIASATTLDINCPKEVYPYEEFECEIGVENLTNIWDIKADITFNGERIAKIYNENEDKWQSSYYYLNDFIKEEKSYKIKLNITSPIYEKIPAEIKLRHDSISESFIFQIRLATSPKNIQEPSILQKEATETTKEPETATKEEKVATIPPKAKITPVDTKTIINKSEVKYKEEVIYESKNQKLKNYTIYGFCLLLIFVITLLLYEKNGKSDYDC